MVLPEPASPKRLAASELEAHPVHHRRRRAGEEPGAAVGEAQAADREHRLAGGCGPAASGEGGRGGHQAGGVGGGGAAQHGLRRPLPHHLAAAHHQDPPAHARDHLQVVADMDERRPEPHLGAGHEVQRPRLHGPVEHDQLGRGDERCGDHHAPALPAGELVGVAAGERRGLGQPRLLHQRPHAGPRLGAAEPGARAR